MAEIEMSGSHTAYTVWKNPTSHEVKLKIFVDANRTYVYRIPPGKTERIPSEFDRGIRKEKNGVVVGGLAPQLVPEGRENVPMHAALASAAAAGDLEREVARTTGIVGDPKQLEAIGGMARRIAELEGKFGQAHSQMQSVKDGADAARRQAEEASKRAEKAQADLRAAQAETERLRGADAEAEALRKKLAELEADRAGAPTVHEKKGR